MLDLFDWFRLRASLRLWLRGVDACKAPVIEAGNA